MLKSTIYVWCHPSTCLQMLHPERRISDRQGKCVTAGTECGQYQVNASPYMYGMSSCEATKSRYSASFFFNNSEILKSSLQPIRPWIKNDIVTNLFPTAVLQISPDHFAIQPWLSEVDSWLHPLNQLFWITPHLFVYRRSNKIPLILSCFEYHMAIYYDKSQTKSCSCFDGEQINQWWHRKWQLYMIAKLRKCTISISQVCNSAKEGIFDYEMYENGYDECNRLLAAGIICLREHSQIAVSFFCVTKFIIHMGLGHKLSITSMILGM